MQQTLNSEIAEVVIVGRDDGHTFRSPLSSLMQNPQVHVKAEYRTLPEALKAGLGQAVNADFVVVLQSWSDEFAQRDINELIGRLLFGRILCCYGPWCTADGRSRELWPVAFRVPAASAASVFEQEIAEFRKQNQPLFPMSAGEEVFVHRSQFPDSTVPVVFRNAIVLSDDPDLRETVAGVLSDLNCDAVFAPVSADKIRDFRESERGNPELAIVDLDGPKEVVEAILETLQSETRQTHPPQGDETFSQHLTDGSASSIGSSRHWHPAQDNRIDNNTTVVGMSVFAASLSTTHLRSTMQLSRILEKTELLVELRHLLKSPIILHQSGVSASASILQRLRPQPASPD